MRSFRLAAVLLVLLTAGCMTRPSSAVLQPVDAVLPNAEVATLLVATNRMRRTAGVNDFSSGRAATLSFAQFAVSIPPTHQPGRIEWPGKGRDSRKSFATISNTALDADRFQAEVAARLQESAGETGDVVVFVHGYNYSFQEALFRFAQIVADTKGPSLPVLFSWPSDASGLKYLADKDGVAYSRDYLERFLDSLAAMPEVTAIHVVGHSMGSWLVAEVLRQARIRSEAPFGGKLGEVVLAAPDIDVDVFRTQLEAIGRLNRPITILVSRDDKLLRLSGSVAGGRDRVGTGAPSASAAQVAAGVYNLRIIDITDMPGPRSNHENYISSIQPLLDMAVMSGTALPERSGFFLMVQGSLGRM